jgi:hypothetical protein
MSTAPTIATFFSCTLTVCFLCVGTGTPSAEKRAPGSPSPPEISNLNVSELREFRFERVLSDQALAPGTSEFSGPSGGSFIGGGEGSGNWRTLKLHHYYYY